jgi:hypothetical protein
MVQGCMTDAPVLFGCRQPPSQDLQHVSDVVGTVSKGLAAETLEKLPRQMFSKSRNSSIDSDR